MKHHALLSLLAAVCISLPTQQAYAALAMPTLADSSTMPTKKSKKDKKGKKDKKDKKSKKDKKTDKEQKKTPISAEKLAKIIANPSEEQKQKAAAYLAKQGYPSLESAIKNEQNSAIFAYLIWYADKQEALLYACRYGKSKYTKWLLSLPGIESNKPVTFRGNMDERYELPYTRMMRGGFKYTPLAEAAEGGHAECLELLLATPGINVNESNCFGFSPLETAAQKGYAECVKVLLAAPGINVNKGGPLGTAPLNAAIEGGNSECVKMLLDAPGINTSSLNAPALAVLKNDVAQCKELLANNADVNKSDLLCKAAILGHTECLKLLLDGSIPDDEKSKALCNAAKNGHVECVKLLLATPGVDANKENSLSWAARNGHTECVKLLLATPGIDVNKADALAWAALNGHEKCVKLLLAAPKINVNQVGKINWHYSAAPLTCAARHGRTECVKLLLAAPDIKVDVHDLIAQARRGRHHETLEILLKNEKKVDAYGSQLQAAIEAGHTDIVHQLLQKGLQPGDRSLQCAIYSNKPEIVKMLVEIPGFDRHLDYGSPDQHALFEAANYGKTEIVKILLQLPDIMGKEHALETAEKKGHTETAKLIRESLKAP